MIAEHKQSHGFNHRNGARKHTRVVTAPGSEPRLSLVFRNRFLFAGNGCGRFECDAEDQVFAVADSALDASGPIALGPNFSLSIIYVVVIVG
jgi:hypothetical protein